MTARNFIEGSIKLKTALHCATPDDYHVNANGYVVQGKAPSGSGGVTATMQMPIIVGETRHTIPYFPANDVRGRLRRKAAKILLDAITVNGKVPIDLYAGLNAGAVSASPEGSEITVEEVLRAKRNVYMGIFGGGTRMIRSSYRAQDIVPIIGSTVAAGMVPEHIANPTGAKSIVPTFRAKTNEGGEEGIGRSAITDSYQITHVYRMIRLDDVTRVLRADELDAYLANAVKEVSEYQQKVLEGRKANKEAKAAGEEGQKKDLGNMMAIQAIVPGTSMYLRLDFADDLTQAQIGLLIKALCDLVNEQALGGWVRAGCGKYDASNLMLSVDGVATRLFVVQDNGTYDIAESAKPYVEQMRKEMAALTAEEMMEFFSSKKPEEKAA